MHKRLTKALVGLVVGVVFAAVVAEIGARVMVARGLLPDRMPADIFAAHAIGWALEPHLSTRIPTSGGLIAIDVNSAGFRDREYARARAADVRRVVVLGDSFTLALETAQAQTFHEQLEARHEGRVEVISLGVSGYGTQQELLAYQYVAREHAPDIVLLMFYIGNDMIDNRGKPGQPAYALEPDGSLVLHGFPYSGAFDLPLVASQRSTWLMRHSALAFLAGVVIRDRTDEERHPSSETNIPQGGGCGYLIGENFPNPTAEDWALTEALLVALRDAVAEDGAELRVVIAPTELQVHDATMDDFRAHCDLPEWVAWPDGYQRRLRAILDAHDIAALDLLPELRAVAAQTGDDLYHAGTDIHWTPAGHAAVARVVDEWLVLD